MTEQQIRQRVSEELRAFDDRFQVLIDLVHEVPLKQPGKEKAQALLKELKEALKESARETEGSRHPFGMLFHSAVHQASSRISVRWNSSPSEKWLSDLYEARVDIGHALSQCRDASEA